MSIRRNGVSVVLLMFVGSWMASTSAFGDTPKRASRPIASPGKPNKSDQQDKPKSLIQVLPGASVEDKVVGLLGTWKNPSPDQFKGVVIPIRVDDSLAEVDTAAFFLKCMTKDKCPVSSYPLIGMKAPGEKLWAFNHIEVTDQGIVITSHMNLFTGDRKETVILFSVPNQVDKVQLQYDGVPQGKPFVIPMRNSQDREKDRDE